MKSVFLSVIILFLMSASIMPFVSSEKTAVDLLSASLNPLSEADITSDIVSAPASESGTSTGSSSTVSNDQTADPTETPVPQEESLISSDSKIELYMLKGERTLSFYIKDKQSGQKWFMTPEGVENDQTIQGAKRLTMQSQLYIRYLDNQSKQIFDSNSIVSSLRQGGLKTEKIKNGIKVIYDFPKAKESFTIPVEYVIDNGDLTVTIKYDEIKEYGDSSITEIALLPYFGAEPAAPGNYLFVPDGCGALLSQDSVHSGMKGYVQPVYGREPVLSTTYLINKPENVHLPVYGIKNKTNGIFAIIESGSSYASIHANPAGIESNFNNAYISFIYRQVDVVVLSDKDFSPKVVTLLSKKPNSLKQVTVRYKFLNADKADYMGMAGLYREYLVQQGVIPHATKEPQFYADIYGAVKKKKSFMGFIITNIMPLTTFEQAENIGKTLKDDGVDNLNLRINGWLSGGMENTVVKSAGVEKKLGGLKGLLHLSRFSDENGISLYMDVEFIKIFKNRLFSWPFMYATHNISEIPAKQNTYKMSTYDMDTTEKPYYLIAPSRINRETVSFLDDFTKSAISNLSVASMGNMNYGDYSASKTFCDREGFKESVLQSLDAIHTKQGAIMLDDANDYVIRYADVVMNTPMYDSSFDISSSDIPFYQIVMHGLINLAEPAHNLSESPDMTFLRQIETGVNPSFIFTWEDSKNLINTHFNNFLNVTFNQSKEEAVKNYKEFYNVYKELNDKLITDYEIVTKNLRTTTFEDGTTIVVNYDASAAAYKGVDINPRGFVVIKGGIKVG